MKPFLLKPSEGKTLGLKNYHALFSSAQMYRNIKTPLLYDCVMSEKEMNGLYGLPNLKEHG